MSGNYSSAPLDAALAHVNPERRRFLRMLLVGVAAVPQSTSAALAAEDGPGAQRPVASTKGGASSKGAKSQVTFNYKPKQGSNSHLKFDAKQSKGSNSHLMWDAKQSKGANSHLKFDAKQNKGANSQNIKFDGMQSKGANSQNKHDSTTVKNQSVGWSWGASSGKGGNQKAQGNVIELKTQSQTKK